GIRVVGQDVAAGGGVLVLDDGIGAVVVVDRDRGLVRVGHSDRDRLRVAATLAVVGLDGDEIAVVVIRVDRRLEIGRRNEGERAGLAVDREGALVGAADDAVGDPVLVLVGGDDRGHRGLILRGRDAGGRAAAVAVDHRRVVGIGHGDRDRLPGGRQPASVGRLDGYLIGVVVIGVARVLEVRRIDEAYRTGVLVDGEQRRVGAAGDAEGVLVARVGIGRDDRAHQGRVLGDRKGRAARDLRR